MRRTLLLRLAGPLAGLQARRLRDQGRYNTRTVAGYWAAWCASGSPVALLRLAALRRDLGRPLPRRWIEPLRAAGSALSPSGRRQALGLLAEVAPGALAGTPSAVWADAAARIPAVAALAPAALAGESVVQRLARVQSQQARWRDDFAAWVASRVDAGGLCVVGNAATLRGLGLGAAIDAHAAVVRFNAFVGEDTAAIDSGRRADVWVAKGDYRGPRPVGPAWTVLSGPDPRYRAVDVDTLDLLGADDTPVLTVPLAVWRGLVRELDAPPSAGLLTLAWLRALRGGWTGVRCAGIGGGLAADGRYHAAIAAKPPGRRHAWTRERALLDRWQAEGLRALDRT